MDYGGEMRWSLEWVPINKLLVAPTSMSYTLPHREAKPPKLNKEHIPEIFHKLIPLAEKYGITDDCYRTELLNSLSEGELEECVTFMEFYDQVLELWLSGPESEGPEFSTEYVTFSALGIMAEEASRNYLQSN